MIQSKWGSISGKLKHSIQWSDRPLNYENIPKKIEYINRNDLTELLINNICLLVFDSFVDEVLWQEEHSSLYLLDDE